MMNNEELKKEVLQVWDYFQRKPNGVFCEVGANHPIDLSQTYFLEQQGWNGVLIEPLPDNVKLLKENRKAKVFPVACGSPEDDPEVELHVAGPGSAITKNLSNWSLEYDESIRVPLKTLDTVLEEAKITETIDFISIDVEGHELNVLKGLDLKKYRPKLFLIEDLVLSLKVHNYMIKQGYKLIKRTGYNNWYIPNDEAYTVPFGDKWKLFRKLYIGTVFRKIKHFFKLLKLRIKSD